jgi:hypothetical protein
MPMILDADRFVARLHERCGICGHCGKKKCAGRQGYSILPAKLLRDDVLAVLDELQVELSPIPRRSAKDLTSQSGAALDATKAP